MDVIDEEEFAWLTQCKQAKAKYRQHFEELREVRSDADYTASLIESTRAQLLADFDAWLQARSLVITPLSSLTDLSPGWKSNPYVYYPCANEYGHRRRVVCTLHITPYY